MMIFGGLSDIRAAGVVIDEDGVGIAETGGLRQTIISPAMAASPEDNRHSSP